MEPIPYPGCYQCPRCNGRDVYIGEKTLSATAITVNTAGPVDPTFVTANKIDVHRCRNCNTEADYIYHPRKKVEMKQQRMKRLKIAGIAVVVIIGLAGLNFGANKIKGSVAASRTESSEKSAVQQVETEYSKWVANAKACNLKERIDHITSADGYPNDRSVFVGITIEPASDLAKFWESDEGIALDCLSQKTVGAQMSQWFTYSNQEIASQQIDMKFLFDEIGVDSDIKGVLGRQGNNYQGQIFYAKADGYHKEDYFLIYFNWQLKPSN